MFLRIKPLVMATMFLLVSCVGASAATNIPTTEGAAAASAVLPVYFCNKFGAAITVYELVMSKIDGPEHRSRRINRFLVGDAVGTEERSDWMNLISGTNDVLQFKLAKATGWSLHFKIEDADKWPLSPALEYTFDGSEKLVVVTVQPLGSRVQIEPFTDDEKASAWLAILKKSGDVSRRLASGVSVTEAVRSDIAAWLAADSDNE